MGRLSRLPAPGRLSIIQSFVNSFDVQSATDRFATPSDLHRWLVAYGLMKEFEPVTEEDLGRALDFREAIRELLVQNAGGTPDPAALALINALGRRSPLGVQVTKDTADPEIQPLAGGIRGALGRLLGVTVAAALDATWRRLKACRNDGCQWVFYDRSKNRTGRWCSMAACGNRTKVLTYRRRRRESGGLEGPTI